MMIIQRESESGRSTTTLEGFLWIRHRIGDDDDSVSSLESLSSLDDDYQANREPLGLKNPRAPTRSAGSCVRSRSLVAEGNCRQLYAASPSVKRRVQTGRRSEYIPRSCRRSLTTRSTIRKNTSEGCLLKIRNGKNQDLGDGPSITASATNSSRWSSNTSKNSMAPKAQPRPPARKSSGKEGHRCSFATTSTQAMTAVASDYGVATPSRAPSVRSERRFSALGLRHLSLADTSSLQKTKGVPIPRSNNSQRSHFKRLGSFDSPRLPPRQLSGDSATEARS